MKEGSRREAAAGPPDTVYSNMSLQINSEMSSCNLFIRGPFTGKMIQEFFVPVTEKHVGFYSSAQPVVHRISRTPGLLPKDLCNKTETEEPNVTGLQLATEML